MTSVQMISVQMIFQSKRSTSPNDLSPNDPNPVDPSPINPSPINPSLNDSGPFLLHFAHWLRKNSVISDARQSSVNKSSLFSTWKDCHTKVHFMTVLRLYPFSQMSLNEVNYQKVLADRNSFPPDLEIIVETTDMSCSIQR